jgi:hypothetical protein
MGNYGCAPTSLGTPADADSMLAVGAVDSLNVIAEWSACGPTYDGRTKPEVLARGRHVFCPDDDDVNGYGYASGTSLSTPLAGGSVALLLEAHPEWGPMDVRAALLQTADRADHPDNQYGWGRINVLAALHSEPVRYPVPFSLISPADDSQLDTRRPALVWHASDDPLSLRSVDYSVWIDDPGDPAGPWSIEAGTDTSLTLPFSLDPETTYRWEVVAESQAGYRRTSRENLTFTTSAFSATREDRAAPRPLPLLCGPNPFRSRIDFVIRSQESLTPIQDRLRWNIDDATGRKVASGETPGSRGEYAASWDGLALGKPAAAGVYYLEARLGASLARETIVRLEP